MNQLILNVKDKSKTELLLKFLKSLNYVTVEKLPEEAIIVSEAEKNLMRERSKKAKPKNFKDWEEIKKQF